MREEKLGIFGVKNRGVKNGSVIDLRQENGGQENGAALLFFTIVFVDFDRVFGRPAPADARAPQMRGRTDPIQCGW